MTKKLFKRASRILTCFPFLMSVLIPKVFNGSAYTQGEGLPAGPKRHAGYHQEIGDRLTTDATIWNRDGDFEQTVFDTGNIQDHCFIGAPWGNDSWGIEGSSFDNNNPLHRIDWARFVSSGHDAYLFGKEESGYWSLVRYIQGDAWGGSNCGTIPWNVPDPLAVNGWEITLYIDIYRDMSNLLTPSNSWNMFAVNVWFNSPELSKRLVMDLSFYHSCNWSDCGLGSFEDAYGYHYQTFLGETPYRNWRSWEIPLNPHIQQALNSFNITPVADSLSIYQLDFVIELRNAEGAATIDNFFLKYEPQGQIYLPIILHNH